MTEILKNYKDGVSFDTPEERRALTKDIIIHFKHWVKKYSISDLEKLHDIVMLDKKDYARVKVAFNKIIVDNKLRPQWMYDLIDQVYPLQMILELNREYTHSKHSIHWDPSALTQLEYLKKYTFLTASHNTYYLSILADYFSAHKANTNNESVLTDIFSKMPLTNINKICEEYPILFERMMPLKPKKWWLSKRTDIYDRHSDSTLVYACFITDMYLKKASNISKQKLQKHQALFPHVAVHQHSNLQYFDDDRMEVLRYLQHCLQCYPVEEVKLWTMQKFPELGILWTLNDNTFHNTLAAYLSDSDRGEEMELHL